jgi:hypothetical protein
VTGDAAASAERDRLRAALKRLQAYDGGSIWDPSTKTLTLQMTSEAAIQQARGIVARASTAMRVTFVKVQYAEQEMEELSSRLLTNQVAWAGASGIGGGYDARSNRVLLQVDRDYKDADRLISAIKRLRDPRVVLQIFESVGGGRESRVADFTPLSAGGS